MRGNTINDIQTGRTKRDLTATEKVELERAGEAILADWVEWSALTQTKKFIASIERRLNFLDIMLGSIDEHESNKSIRKHLEERATLTQVLKATRTGEYKRYA